MKGKRLYLVLLAVLVMALVGCTPKAVPQPAPDGYGSAGADVR